MFNSEFFPTRKTEIAIMLEPYYKDVERPYKQRVLNLKGRTILDPSAGSGSILEFIQQELSKDYHSRQQANLYCCETDPQLKATLQGKQFRQVGDDFLSYRGDTIFDLIIMNPPFSNADQHILHAYQVVGHGGDVVALCNSETIRNPYTRSRQQLARLIEDFGSVQELGQVFREAERTSDVEVSLIRLHKPAADSPFNFNWSSRGQETHATLDENTFSSQVATRDVIGNMITQFTELKKHFVDLMRAMEGIKFYGRDLVGSEYHGAWSIAQDCLTKDSRATCATRYNDFTTAMRQEIWQKVMSRLSIEKFMTDEVRREFSAFQKAQGYQDFTLENVWQLVGFVLDNKGTILEKAVVDVFDELTNYYPENRLHVEGWKTNSKYKVNRKVILPNWVKLCEFMGTFDLSSSRWSSYSDLDKVCCFLAGRDYDKCYTITQALETRFRRLGKVGKGTFSNECESEFFNIRFFKKGTVHLEFKDEFLWAELNLRACAGKQWLPEPEMQAYQQRKRGPFDPAPAPEQTPPAPAELAPVAIVRRLAGAGTQLSLLDLAA